MTNFDSLGLSEALLRAIRDKGYKTPTPIQAKAIPAVLAGNDVFAAAQTGTGKTAGFTLPLLQHLESNRPPNGKRVIRALAITPTRELAAQIQESVKDYGKYLSLQSTVVFGGVPINPQKRTLARGVDILVATPGRLLDLANQRCVDLSTVQFLVLDEADRMLDMGFIHDIRRVLALLPKQRQNLLFSATFSEDIRKLASGFMNDPVSISVSPKNTTAETVSQQMYKVAKSRKPAMLVHLIKNDEWKQVLVFTRTKHGANRLARKLGNSGIHSTAIHGNKSQGARTKALRDFKSGQVRVLVATDIAARGLDIEQLPWVVNFELPNVPEDYVHRIGRTGRAGMKGQAVSFVCGEEQKQLRGIERLLGKRMSLGVVEGFEPDSGEVRNEPRPKMEARKSKSLPGRNQQRRKPVRKEGPKTDGERTKDKEEVKSDNRQERSGDRRKQGNRRNKPNSRSNNSNGKSKSNANTKSNSESKSNSETNSKRPKSVPFSKAHKKRKPGKRGPIGYGMYPLE